MTAVIVADLIALRFVFTGMDESAAGIYLTSMRLHKRYLEDVWV